VYFYNKLLERAFGVYLTWYHVVVLAAGLILLITGSFPPQLINTFERRYPGAVNLGPTRLRVIGHGLDLLEPGPISFARLAGGRRMPTFRELERGIADVTSDFSANITFTRRRRGNTIP